MMLHTNRVISFEMGSNQATVNGQTYTLPRTIEDESGVVYIPIRFVAEQLGTTLLWDELGYSIIMVQKYN
ncbi:copper amine oxidase N-terminal domain-containing protein [Longirhabdus pacifica]|uniref:copper amine oxidase N-terminal domain-containing protein n=1 Tax=Longirhabdus pacifica TaxID=2305227 RepID=UPI0010091DD4|nr:copper amine oxidase N-terminal domain-containing protein [Longirhabdus pacifica]